ncbi:hypothetical protein BJF87_15500 [Gordonia sp. CNJ-863]|nr:hypothetical protein BJF87_15500 [Gordonia sp. CNJ-863]
MTDGPATLLDKSDKRHVAALVTTKVHDTLDKRNGLKEACQMADDGKLDPAVYNHIRSRIVSELKDIRRFGLTEEAMEHAPVITMGFNRPRQAIGAIEYLISANRFAQNLHWLTAALALDGRYRGVELTERRRVFAGSKNISTRTLIRYEDAAIDWLAGRLVESTLSTAEGKKYAQAVADNQSRIGPVDAVDAGTPQPDRPVDNEGARAQARRTVNRTSSISTGQRPVARNLRSDPLKQDDIAAMSVMEALDHQEALGDMINEGNKDLRAILSQLEVLRRQQSELTDHLSSLQKEFALVQERINRG